MNDIVIFGKRDGLYEHALLFFGRKPADHEDVEPPLLRPFRIAFQAKRFANAVGNDVELSFISVLFQLSGNKIGRTVDMREIFIKFFAEERI